MSIAEIEHGGRTNEVDCQLLHAMYAHLGPVVIGKRLAAAAAASQKKGASKKKKKQLRPFFSDEDEIAEIVNRAVALEGGGVPTLDRISFVARRRLTLDSARSALVSSGYEGIDIGFIDELLSGRVAFNGGTGSGAGANAATAEWLRQRVAVARLSAMLAVKNNRGIVEEDTGPVCRIQRRRRFAHAVRAVAVVAVESLHRERRRRARRREAALRRGLSKYEGDAGVVGKALLRARRGVSACRV